MQGPPRSPSACPCCGPSTTWSRSSKQTQLRCPYRSPPGIRAANEGAHDRRIHLILAAADGVPKGVETWWGHPCRVAARLGTNGQWGGRTWSDTRRSQQGQGLRGHRRRFGGWLRAASTNQPWSSMPRHLQAASPTVYYSRCSHNVRENVLHACAVLGGTVGCFSALLLPLHIVFPILSSVILMPRAREPCREVITLFFSFSSWACAMLWRQEWLSVPAYKG